MFKHISLNMRFAPYLYLFNQLKFKIMKSIIKITFFAIALFSVQSIFAQNNVDHKMADNSDVTVIHLTQTKGEFETKNLNLKPGKYIFEVTNNGVDHEVAFMLASAKTPKEGIQAAGLPKLLKDGETQKSNVVELKEGTYLYNCPLNPTPQYTVTVK